MRARETRIIVLSAALLLLATTPGCWSRSCDCEETDTGDSEVLQLCPPVDIVFLMDTSSSMDDEAVALCESISAVETELRSLGLAEIRVTLLGIVNTPTIVEPGAADSPPGPEFDCLTNTVYRILGGDGEFHPVVPGNPPAPTTLPSGQFIDPTVLDPGNNESEEFWGPATALIAGLFDWLPDPAPNSRTIRIIVPISDESPQSGQGECAPVDDAAVLNAIQVALQNRVLVSPVLGTADGERDPCIGEWMAQIANETGGTFTDSGASENFDLARSIYEIVLAACEQVDVEPS